MSVDESPLDHRGTLTVAAQALATRCGCPIELELTEPLVEDKGYRHTVLRCHVRCGDSALPPTVVIKESNAKGGRFAVELAALRFMSTLPSRGKIAPQLLAVDVDNEVLVLEDLSAGPRLRELLSGTDQHLTEECLIGLMRLLATLHAETRGREREYKQILVQAGGRIPIDHSAYRLEADLQRITDVMALVGIRPDPGLDDDLAWLTEVLNGGTFRCFTSGDIAPVNCLMADGAVRLVDFEVSDYRNGLVDGCYPQMRHLVATDACRLPAELKRRMAAVYREQIQSKGVTLDEDDYNRCLVASSAAWMATICRPLQKALVKDKVIRLSSRRQRILAGLGEFALLENASDLVPTFRRTVVSFRDELASRWEGEIQDIPPFPVFTQDASAQLID